MLNQLFVELSSMPDFDEDSLDQAKELFEEYKNKKTLVNCSFEDESWTMTDEYSVIGLNFRFMEFSYRRHYEEIFDMNLADFIDHVKCFVTSILGKYAATTIRDFLNDIRKIVSTNPNQLSKGNISLFSASICLDFLYLTVNESGYELTENIENSVGYKPSNQRNLAAFDSYFLFGDIMDDFWASDLSKEIRLFYYPLYLWWHITGVLPMRPREFLVTARDCLTKEDDGYWLTLRKNQLKGRRDRGIKYKIKEDYKSKSYRINDAIAYELQRYIDWTEQYDRTEIDTLFIMQPHYDRWNRTPHKKSRFYSRQNLFTCMNYFYKEVIEGIYHLKVVDKTDHLAPGEICYINLGDTRHLSLSNIMLEGGTPALAMEFAGHENPDMAAHYYSNITNLIECRTYRQYRKVLGGTVSYQLAHVTSNAILEKGTKLSDGNICFSKEYANGSISDCLKSAGPNGELAYCPKCRYYRLANESFFSADDKFKEKIKENCELLTESINLVRKGKGYEESIGEAWNKLKASALTYSEYLNAKGELEWEERKQ